MEEMTVFDRFVAWWKLRRASHYVTLVFGLLVAAYVGYAPFHALLLSIYHALPGWVEVLIGAAIYLITLYKPNILQPPVTLDTVHKSTAAPKAAALLVVAALSVGMLTTSGCTASEVNSVVTKISSYTPTVISLVSEALTIYEAVGVSTTDTTSVSASLTTINTDLAQLKTLASDYLAASSKASKNTAWSNIEALVDTLTSDADTVLTTASIKNSDSRAAGVGVLASLDAAIHILDGYVSSAQSTSTVNAKLARRTIKLRQVSALWCEQDRQQVAIAVGIPYDAALRYADAHGF
jgi:hypothetical protein